MIDLQLFEKQILTSLDERILSLILFPTEKCNFRCSYCYEDYNIGKMSKQTTNGIKKLISNRFNDLQLLDISWFGGEPLLGKDIIYDISDFILKNKPSSLNYTSNMTTNGYLLNETVFKKLIEYNIKYYQISLDGDKDMHNESRILANGKPTFDKIWENITMMHHSDYDFNLMIRIHYTIDNYKMLSSLITKLNQQFSNDKRIKFYFKAVERLGGINDSNITQLDENEKASIKSLLDNQIQAKEQIESGYDINSQPHICYASKPNSLAIRANGRIAKCTVALDNDRNDIGYISPTGELHINDKFNLWIQGLEGFHLPTLACPLNRLKAEESMLQQSCKQS